LHAGAQRKFRNQLLYFVRNDARRGRWRKFEALTLVNMHPELEIAHAQLVAIKKAPRLALAEWLVLVIHVNTVGAHVREVVGAALVIDCCVPAGNKFVRVGENPVVPKRAAYGAAVLAKQAHMIVAKEILVLACDFQL
jgi:hypothetical protein